MHQHLGHSGGDITHIQQGEDTEEEIHGSVETHVQAYQGDDEPIAQDWAQVKKKEGTEEDPFGSGVTGEAKQDKFRNPGSVLSWRHPHGMAIKGSHSFKCNLKYDSLVSTRDRPAMLFNSDPITHLVPCTVT